MVVSAIAVVGIGGYFLFDWWKRRRDSKTPAQQLGDVGANSATNIGQSAQTPSSNPFANDTQVNVFRTWVNKFHSKYAKDNQIDPMGKWNDAYVGKAYNTFKEAFLRELSSSFNAVQSMPFSKLVQISGSQYAVQYDMSTTFTGLKPYYVMYFPSGSFTIFGTDKTPKISGAYFSGGKMLIPFNGKFAGQTISGFDAASTIKKLV